MTYTPTPEQIKVINATDPVLVVLGGAGTGKTTTAAVAARKRIEDAESERLRVRRDALLSGKRAKQRPPARALFLSFSRTAVAQVIDRASSVIGPTLQRLDVATFDGFAWRVINDFGAHYGYPPPQSVVSAASAKVPGAPQGLTYQQLIPAARKLLALSNVGAHYDDRYCLVICDEFQDTNDLEWEFMQEIAPAAPRMLLGDANQCIYADMKRIDPEVRIADACALPGAQRVDLSAESHRDPSQVLPAAAAAALRRKFSHPYVATAASSGRLRVTRKRSPKGYAEIVDLTARARHEGRTVNIFTHTNNATADLSDALTDADVRHEQVGFGEAHGEALSAQLELLRYAWRQEAAPRRALAVYMTANYRGKTLPDLAQQVLDRTNPALERQIEDLANNLVTAGDLRDVEALAQHVREAYAHVGMERGQETWTQASAQFRSALNLLNVSTGSIAAVEAQLGQAHDDTLLNCHRQAARQVQVMNLHQTKGREADVTLLLLQEDEWHGREREPFPKGSRLLYVVMTRARQEAHIVCGTEVHALWRPLVEAVEKSQP
ncbi:Superfamily I DNA or RNA helicase [Geodermatophilus siccatus]|uniref:Superfamily I DNA or RNA helicase n=1 Tax=Geodermatophilus siccatus TaxID=1137991 RepID=A0A1G9PT67_9ACTN|nr:UvrD-helicase domain-containing protein [Geodermatophilus siccatus]SDM01984.1 Superfamily I DNA or RNA helicase [Geodermatophilus siccatus]